MKVKQETFEKALNRIQHECYRQQDTYWKYTEPEHQDADIMQGRCEFATQVLKIVESYIQEKRKYENDVAVEVDE